MKRYRGNLNCTLLSERSQAEKDIYCLVSVIPLCGKGTTMEHKKIPQYHFTQWQRHVIIHLSKFIEGTTPRVNHINWDFGYDVSV